MNGIGRNSDSYSGSGNNSGNTRSANIINFRVNDNFHKNVKSSLFVIGFMFVFC